jgi:hypothetical protein
LVSSDEFVTLLFVRELRLRRVPLSEILNAERDFAERSGQTATAGP